jgi:glycosyltransferase involved in cell wall biosynthesis
MKILLLIRALSGGGAERQTALLASELLRRDHDVVVGHFDAGPGDWPTSIPTHRFPRRNSHNPLQILDVMRWMRSWKPDVVQTCLPRMDVVGGIAAMALGVPWVLREPTNVRSYGKGNTPRLRVLVARLGVGTVIANSEAGADYWESCAPRISRSVVRNSVSAESRGDGREPAGRAVGLYTGRLVPEKNVDIVLRACASVERLELEICGDGPLRNRLEALAGDLGVGERVHFRGFVSDLAPARAASHFAILVSEFEGHPNAAAEAFAAGLPLILSDIAMHREIATDEEAFFVPLRDVRATASAMRLILTNPGEAARRARNAQRRSRGWTTEEMSIAYEAIYARLAGRAMMVDPPSLRSSVTLRG